MNSTRLVLVLALLTTLIGTSSPAAFAEYSYTSIQPAGSVFTVPFGMNDAGVITGFYAQPSGFFTGFVRAADGTITTAQPPATVQAILGGVNNSGIAAGAFLDFGFVNHSATYNIGTDTWTPLPDIGGTAGSVGVGINIANVITGYSITGFTGSGSLVGCHGYFYDGSAYSFYDVPNVDLSFDGTIPEDINDSGTVVGFFTPQGRGGLFSGFVRDALGNYTILDHPGADSTFVQGINNQGIVAGSYEAGGISHSFLWSSSGGFTAFDLPFGFNTEIWGIDNNNNLVGTYITAAGSPSGFLAAPVPEPSTIAFFALASMGVVCHVTRRSQNRHQNIK